MLDSGDIQADLCETYLKNCWLAVEDSELELDAWSVQLTEFQVLLQFCQGSGLWKELKR